MARDKDFKYTKKQEGDWIRFELSGPVTEYAREALLQLGTEGSPKAVLDLKGVTFANSTGIRDWSYMLKDFKSGRSVVFENVPDEIVRTMNMVLGFRQGLPIKSLLRVYCCDGCGHEFTRTMKLGLDYEENKIPEAKKIACEKCGADTMPPDPDEDFFMFLTDVA